MKKITVFVFAINLVIGSGLSACNLSLAQDVTPPPGFEAMVIQETFEPESFPPDTSGEIQPPSGESASLSDAEGEPSVGGAVFGSVVNGSGGELPGGLEVTLYGFEGFEVAVNLTGEVDEAGNFVFENVAMAEDFVFFVVVEYMDISYISEFYQVKEGETHIELSAVVYEATTDPSALVVDRLHVFFTYPTPDTVQVIHTLSVSNPGNKTVVSASEEEPSLRYILPEGATNLSFTEGSIGQPYVLTADGFGDPSPILPGMGEYQIVYLYNMPYSREMTWVQPLTIPTNVVVLFIPEGDLKMTGDQLEASGTETFNEILYRTYLGGARAAGEEIAVEISGRNPSAGTGLAFSSNTTSIILGSLGLVLAGIGVWWWFRSDQVDESGTDDGESPEVIMDEIIALDENYEAGKIKSAVYKKRRDALKARLSKLVE